MRHFPHLPWCLPLLLAAGLLSSCEDFVPRADTAVAMRPAWRQIDALPQSGTVQSWWQGFGSPQLDSLVTKALEGNFGVEAAHQRLIAARTLQGAGDSCFRPSGELNTASERNPQATAEYFLVGVDATWELPMFGRAANAGRLLQAQVADAQSDLDAARAALVADVVRVYLESRFVQRERSVVEELASVAEDRHARQATRIRLGLDDEAAGLSDLQQAQQARAELTGLLSARQRGLESLAALLGSPDVDDAWMANDGELRVPDVPGSVPADLLRRRPDIRRAESEVERAAAELGISRADRYPSVTLAGALTASVPVAGRIRGNTNGIVSAGPVISMPLFDWGLRKAQADAHGAALQAATLDYRQKVLDAVAEVEQALLQVGEANEQAKLRAKSVEAAEQAAQRAQVRRQLGLQQQVAALDLRRDALLARQSQIRAELMQSLALVHLMLALGVG